LIEPSLLPVCGIAFLSVFILLALLAYAMRLITVAFPAGARAGEGKAADPATVAAIASTVAALYPGAQVSKIEEEES
jgi:Na+-transporting methylmalonyl-CoA/oxaloacetate decarboxylase gamma subunit